jgi:hypothetical protein
MGRTWTFLLNSDIAGNANTANCRYFIDWCDMPLNKRYKMNFTFVSATGILTNTEVANVFVDLGHAQGVICPPENNSAQAYKSGYIGSLQWQGTATGKLSASMVDNPPVWFDSRPIQNTIRVEIHTATATQMTDYAPVPKYSMTLCFEEQPDEYVPIPRPPAQLVMGDQEVKEDKPFMTYL